RAELRLEERTALWKPTKQRRFLPALPEFLHVWLGVPRKKRKPEQRELLRAAAKYHGLISGGVLLIVLLIGVATQQYVAAQQRASDLKSADALVDAVLNTSPAGVPAALDSLEPYHKLALPLLQEEFQGSRPGSSQQFHAAFALAKFGEAPVEFL